MGHGAQKHGSTPLGSRGLEPVPPIPFPVIEQGITGEGDVLLFQTIDDGEITFTGGLIEMHGGLRTSSYLSLFGGNEEDDGSIDNELTWWGNIGENDPAKKYLSRTQHLLRSIPATTSNIERIKTAVSLDLEWFITQEVATKIIVAVSIPALNKVQIDGTITTNKGDFSFKFTENWRNF